MTGTEGPLILTELAGPNSKEWVDRLAQRECPAITARRARRASSIGASDVDPVVWKRARGSCVEDEDGNRFVDLTSGFGVASVGHAHPEVVAAGKEQLERLPHAMGDAFPDAQRIRLLEQLAKWTGMDHGILGSSGSDAVEAALKTARIATGRDGVLAFEGAYHGLSYGALSASHYKHEMFRGPFVGQLGQHVSHMPFGELPESLENYGAVLVEPIQGRGGMRCPPEGWLAALAERCRRDGALLVLDEIYTGFGRTGTRFAYQESGIQPDLLCLGKGMAGGFPISACMGTKEAMEAWGASRGEAIHTQTFLGNPVGCAMALACMKVIENEDLTAKSKEDGQWLEERLSSIGVLRGRGLMRGLEVAHSLKLSRDLLEQGYITLPAGLQAEVLAIVPPLTVTRQQLEAFCDCLESLL
jgi:4-aminobutyrate aminotransferase-like enzyme